MSAEQEFHLDQRLASDTRKIASWPLCEVLLMNDSQYPWCILVPRVDGLSELFQLARTQRQQLDLESIFLSKILMNEFEAEKLNVAALGNVVKQLHIHHVVRYSTDPSWPAPVWGRLPAQSYTDEELAQRLEKLSDLFEPDWAAIALSNA